MSAGYHHEGILRVDPSQDLFSLLSVISSRTHPVNPSGATCTNSKSFHLVKWNAPPT
jgi:hypothetical protein